MYINYFVNIVLLCAFLMYLFSGKNGPKEVGVISAIPFQQNLIYE